MTTESGVIDLHAHVVLEDSLGAAGPHGPFLDVDGDEPVFTAGGYSLRGVRYRGTPFMDVELRLERMAANGIDHQLLTPNPITWFHHIDAADAISYCRAHNDALARVVAVAPARLSGAAQLPVQNPTAAADELRRACGELGLVGGAMGTDVGRPLDDPSLDAIWSTAESLDVPLFLHPAPAATSGVGEAGDSRLGFELHGWFCHSETRAVTELVFGRVLERFEDLDVWISHGGGATALLAGRWRHAMATRPDGTGDGKDLDRWLARLWFDTHLADDDAVSALVAAVGTDRLVLGTNFSGWDDTGVHHHGLSPARLAANARRLLRVV